MMKRSYDVVDCLICTLFGGCIGFGIYWILFDMIPQSLNYPDINSWPAIIVTGMMTIVAPSAIIILTLFFRKKTKSDDCAQKKEQA